MVVYRTYSTVAIQILVALLFPFCSLCISFPSQNAPSLFNHNLTIPALGPLKINCYRQPPLPIKRLPRAGIHDCYTALQYLLRGEKTMAPIQFTEDDRRGFAVPFAWAHGTCQIIINNLTPNAEETFSFALIAHLAAEITEACVLELPGSLGGEVKLGNRNLFEVVVAGTGSMGGIQGTPDAGQNEAPAAVAAAKRRT
ncbi:MAG: hypothetical protein Q9168_006528 [Polycauliona sp. 1 TL-2023]